MQKSLVISVWWDNDGNQVDNTEDLNNYLQDGWKVVSTNPMGGAAYGYGYAHGYNGLQNTAIGEGSDITFCSLVIVEK